MVCYSVTEPLLNMQYAFLNHSYCCMLLLLDVGSGLYLLKRSQYQQIKSALCFYVSDSRQRPGERTTLLSGVISLFKQLRSRRELCVHLCVFCLRSTNEVKNLLQSLPRSSEPREMLFEDRTRAHADHIGQGFERQTTAAVGVLKAVCAVERWANTLLMWVYYRAVYLDITHTHTRY